MCVAALHRPARQTMILPMEPVQHVQLTVRLPVQYAQEGAAVIAHTPGSDVASHGASKRQITPFLDTFIEREALKLRVNAQGA